MASELIDSFDDYHGLLQRNLGTVRLMIFEGMSGSGKSTAIDYLCRRHRHFRNRRPRVFRISTSFRQAPLWQNELVVLDEVCLVKQLLLVQRLLRCGNTVLVASHLASHWFLPLRLCWPSQVFVMDRDEAKIGRYLRRKEVPFSTSSVRVYCRFFGANYVDVDFILERYPDVSFDEALGRFRKFCRLQLMPQS